MPNIKHTIQETATHVKNAVTETAGKVGRAASEAVHTGEHALSDAAHKAKDLAVGAADKIRNKGKKVASQAQDGVKPAADKVADAGNDDNLSKLEAQLKTWRAKLDELVAKANVAGQQAQIDSRKQLEELKSKLEVARSKLDEAKAAGIGKWETLRQGVERTWQELEADVQEAGPVRRNGHVEYHLGSGCGSLCAVGAWPGHVVHDGWPHPRAPGPGDRGRAGPRHHGASARLSSASVSHHVYLAPGMFGFGRLASYDYFAHVERALDARFRDAGETLETHVVDVLPTASVRRRAAKLAELIAARRPAATGPIHLLGHSTGGLDVRLVASPGARAPGPRRGDAAGCRGCAASRR